VAPWRGRLARGSAADAEPTPRGIPARLLKNPKIPRGDLQNHEIWSPPPLIV